MALIMPFETLTRKSLMTGSRLHLPVTRKRNKLAKDNNLDQVVQKVDNAIHWINHYPLDVTI